MKGLTTMNLLTPEQARQRLSLGRNTIYALLRTGMLKSVRIGRAVRVSEAEIQRFIESGGTPIEKGE
jgi:excisionase family DNA binding protein